MRYTVAVSVKKSRAAALLKHMKAPGSARRDAGFRGLLEVTTVVEMGGIEPPSIAGSLRLLRAQSVQTFCSAPTFVTDT